MPALRLNGKSQEGGSFFCDHAGGRGMQRHPGRPEETRSAGFMEMIRACLNAYRDTLPEDRRVLYDRLHLVDIAVKAVGIGSVGTVCAVLLGVTTADRPFFLQVKEANASVLEPYAGASAYPHHGQRPATRGPSAATWARAARSTRRWASSHFPMPIRPNATTRRSRQRSQRARWACCWNAERACAATSPSLRADASSNVTRWPTCCARCRRKASYWT